MMTIRAVAVQKVRPVMQCWPAQEPSSFWALATVADESVRDGKEAVVLAERAMRLTSRGSPIAIGTLAAACAAAGDFPRAVSFSKEAIELSEARGETALAARLKERLKLFEKGQAIRQ